MYQICILLSIIDLLHHIIRAKLSHMALAAKLVGTHALDSQYVHFSAILFDFKNIILHVIRGIFK